MRPPVFIVGSSRSGTTLLYHMILSSGGFAVYRAETNVFSLLPPYFGDLRKEKNRKKLINFWTNSVLFKRSGLQQSQWSKQFSDRCITYSDLLVFFMESIAKQQKVDRWAECTPTHLLHMKKIKQGIPDAKFIHIIRDGRDVAISLDKLGWIKAFTTLGLDTLCSAALIWEWGITKGRQIGSEIGNDYTEIFFEELIKTPEIVLSRLGKFIDHELDYNRIKAKGIGSVNQPNTAFKKDKFSPIERWRSLPLMQLTNLEKLIGITLAGFGYKLTNSKIVNSPSFKTSNIKLLLKSYLHMKYWLKYFTPIGHYFGETPEQFDSKMFQIFRNSMK